MVYFTMRLDRQRFLLAAGFDGYTCADCLWWWRWLGQAAVQYQLTELSVDGDPDLDAIWFHLVVWAPLPGFDGPGGHPWLNPLA